MNKNDIFKYQPERENERDYFLNSFPSMPDKAGLFVGMNAIAYMSDEAFVYYLPFFLKYCLEHPEHDVSDVEMIMRMLGGRQSKVETPNYIEDMIEPFTCDQIKAIGEFVKIAMRLFDGRIPHSDFDHLVERYVQSP